MTVNVSVTLRQNQSAELSWAQLDSNFASVANAVNALGVQSDNNTAGLAQFEADLAGSDPAKGAAMVGGVGRVIDSISALRALPKTGTARVFVTGYYAAGDGGGGHYWYDNSDTTSADNGGTVIVATDGGRWKLIVIGSISVKQFGARGDFNPATGTGTDDRAAINAALAYAISVAGGRKVVFPSGRYYGGAAAGAFAGGVQIALGTTTAGSARNIELIGDGAELYQGAAGRFFGIFGASGVKIHGFRMYGYVGGTIDSSRQNDALITVNYNSDNVEIFGNYLTNSLGDQIYVGGSLVSGGETGYQSSRINIHDNILKTRYGNGTASSSGGTMSRTAIAVIDVVGLNVHDNWIYGGIDLEPNLDNQHLIDIQVHDNKFKSGNVTAQGAIGTSYWLDEPINLSGGTVIPQYVAANGVAANPVVSNVCVTDNQFEQGQITCYNVYAMSRISDNLFLKGLIQLGSTSGSNSTTGMHVVGNKALANLTGFTTFIQLAGNLTYSQFINNVAAYSGSSGFTNCINNNGASTGDNGRNSFIGNICDSSAVLGFTPANTSVSLNNWGNAGASYEIPYSKSLQVRDLIADMQTLNVSGAALSLDWNTYHGNVWYINCGAVNTSVAQMPNPPRDGFELTVISGATSGASLTFTHNASFIRLKGAVDAVLANNSATITFVSRAGIWFEKARNF